MDDPKTLFQSILADLARLFSLLWPSKPAPEPVLPPPPPPEPVKPPSPPPTPTPVLSLRERLLKTALLYVGKDASPEDAAPDELGCAESLCRIVRRLLPDFPVLLSTKTLYEQFKKDKRFKGSLDMKPGNVIISVTGTGNGRIPNGHVGIIGEGSTIMSNDSASGQWRTNYTIATWAARYRDQGGYKLHVFEPTG